MCVCVEKEREREREREREHTVSFPRPAYPKIHLSGIQTVWVRIFIFMIGLFSLFCVFVLFSFLFVCFGFFCFFFADAPLINQDKKVSKDNFSIIYLLRTVCELTFSIKQMHYKTGTLCHSDASIFFMSAVVLDERHSDAFILFTSAKVPSASAKVILDKRPYKFLPKQCTVCTAFTDADMSFFERLMSGGSLFPWSLAFFLLFLGSVQSLATNHFVYNPSYVKMANFR